MPGIPPFLFIAGWSPFFSLSLNNLQIFLFLNIYTHMYNAYLCVYITFKLLSWAVIKLILALVFFMRKASEDRTKSAYWWQEIFLAGKFYWQSVNLLLVGNLGLPNWFFKMVNSYSLLDFSNVARYFSW